MRHVWAILLLIVLLLPFFASATPNEAKGIVTNVADGDTIDVQLQEHNSLVTSDNIKVRLADIDCPEISTAHGPAARQYTSQCKKIKSSNLITFASSADARAHGYVRCGICHPP